MSAQVVGLWLGGAISVEAAEKVEAAVIERAKRYGGKLGIELYDLANAIRAQIQRVVPDDPSDGLI